MSVYDLFGCVCVSGLLLNFGVFLFRFVVICLHSVTVNIFFHFVLQLFPLDTCVHRKPLIISKNIPKAQSKV